MRQNRSFFIFSALFLSILYACSHENPFFRIREKDVRLYIPKEFPSVSYDFTKNPITPEGFFLGRKLFYDPILSRDSSTSCGSCHQRIAAFGHIDHRLSHGINGLIGTRNVPAIQNIIWQPNFMWDGGINHLDLQPIAPITSSIEMDETLVHLIEKLNKHKVYPKLFKKAFKKNNIESADLLKALSQFVALMVSDSSKYDKYMRGEITFSSEEEKGLILFRKHCENCHKEPLFSDFSFRNIGLAPDTALKDYGRYRITGLKSDSMKFRVPSLRNVEITYPYMHDGRFPRLKHVLDHYANGKFFTENVDELVKKNVGLSQEERAALIAFLKTLTDRSYTYDRRFIDPNPPSF